MARPDLPRDADCFGMADSRRLVKDYYRRTPSGALIRVKGYVRGPAEEPSPSGRLHSGIGPPRPVFSPDPSGGEKTKAGTYGTPTSIEALRIARDAYAKARREKLKGDPMVAATLLSTVSSGQTSVKALREIGVAQEIVDLLRILLKR